MYIYMYVCMILGPESYLGHVELPVQSLLQLVQRGGDLLQQRVQTSALLNQHHEVWPVRIQQPLQ